MLGGIEAELLERVRATGGRGRRAARRSPPVRSPASRRGVGIPGDRLHLAVRQPAQHRFDDAEVGARADRRHDAPGIRLPGDRRPGGTGGDVQAIDLLAIEGQDALVAEAERALVEGAFEVAGHQEHARRVGQLGVEVAAGGVLVAEEQCPRRLLAGDAERDGDARLGQPERREVLRLFVDDPLHVGRGQGRRRIGRLGLVGRRGDRGDHAPGAVGLAQRRGLAAAGDDLQLLDLGAVDPGEHLAGGAARPFGRRRLAVPLDEVQVGHHRRGRRGQDRGVAPAVHPRRLHQL